MRATRDIGLYFEKPGDYISDLACYSSYLTEAQARRSRSGTATVPQILSQHQLDSFSTCNLILRKEEKGRRVEPTVFIRIEDRGSRLRLRFYVVRD